MHIDSGTNISHAWRPVVATCVIAITVVTAVPALASAQRVGIPASAPAHAATGIPARRPQPFTGPLLTSFQMSLEVSTDGSTFGKQAAAQNAPQYSTSAPGQSATIPVTLRWTALPQPAQPAQVGPLGGSLKLMGYAVFRADQSRSAWDSVAFTAQPSISTSAPVSPEDNALFRVAPVYQQIAFSVGRNSSYTGQMVGTTTNWTADTTAAVRVITR